MALSHCSLPANLKDQDNLHVFERRIIIASGLDPRRSLPLSRLDCHQGSHHPFGWFIILREFVVCRFAERYNQT